MFTPTPLTISLSFRDAVKSAYEIHEVATEPLPDEDVEEDGGVKRRV